MSVKSAIINKTTNIFDSINKLEIPGYILVLFAISNTNVNVYNILFISGLLYLLAFTLIITMNYLRDDDRFDEGYDIRNNFMDYMGFSKYLYYTHTFIILFRSWGSPDLLSISLSYIYTFGIIMLQSIITLKIVSKWIEPYLLRREYVSIGFQLANILLLIITLVFGLTSFSIFIQLLNISGLSVVLPIIAVIIVYTIFFISIIRLRLIKRDKEEFLNN